MLKRTLDHKSFGDIGEGVIHLIESGDDNVLITIQAPALQSMAPGKARRADKKPRKKTLTELMV